MDQFVPEPGGDGRPSVLTVTGEIDLVMVDDFVRAGTECLDGENSGLAIDMAGVSFLDSTGVGALVTLRERAVTLGKSITVRNPSKPVLKVLRITGLDELF